MPRNVRRKALPIAREADAFGRLLVLVSGPTAAGWHWAYAFIRPSRFPAFCEAEQASAGYRLADYADEILAHGPGEAPPPELTAELETRYGANPRFEEEFRALLDAAESKAEA